MQENSKDEKSTTVSKKLQSEIDSLKYPAEVLELHVRDPIFKHITNDRVDDVINELKNIQITKHESGSIKHDSNTGIIGASIVQNTSINPHEKDPEGGQKRKISEKEFKAIFMQ